MLVIGVYIGLDALKIEKMKVVNIYHLFKICW